MVTKATYEITAEDRTKAAIDSAKRGLKGLADHALNMKGLLAGAFGALSAAGVAAAFKSVVDGADSMSKLAQATGFAVEELSALNYAAKLSGVQTAQLGAGLRLLAKNATDTANGTGEAKDAFAALGISVTDATGKVRDGGDLINAVADKFAGLEDGSQKTALAMRIFGESGAALIPLLNGGSEALSEAKEEATLFGQVLTAEGAQAAEQFNDNVGRLGDALAGPFREGVIQALPALRQISEEMVQATKESGILQAAIVGLSGAFKYLFTDELDSQGDKLDRVNREIGRLEVNLSALRGVASATDTSSGVNQQIAAIEKQLAVLKQQKAELEKPVKIEVDPPGEGAKTALKDIAAETKRLKDEEKRLAAEQKAAAKEADAYATRLQSLVDELDPIGKQTRDYLQAVADLDRAWVAGLISGEEYDRLMMALATDTEALEKAQEEAVKAQEEAAKKREELARKEAEAMQRPFDEAAEGIQDAFTDAFAEIYDGNVRSFGDLARQIKGVFVRLAAEITTLLVFNPKASIGSLLGGVGLGGSGAALAGTGTGGGFNLPGLSSIGNLLGPAGSLLGIGGGIGALGSTLWGGSSLGSSLGGAAGFYGGTLLGSGSLGAVSGALAGTLGTLGNFVIPGLGAVLGGFLGSKLFGKKPSNKSAWGAIDLSSGATSNFGNMTGSKFSQETVDARDSFFQAIGGFSSALQQITGGTLTGSVSADIGLRDGTQVSGLGAGRYADPQQALDAIFRSMMTNIQGIDAEWRNVFARLDLSDMEQAVADLQIAGTIINRDYVQAEPLSEAAAAIRQITDSFDPLIDSANRLGLATAGLYTEQNRLINQLRTDFDAAIEQQILSITDPLQAALNEADRVAEERLRNARDLGTDLVDVERLNALERQRIIEEHNAQTNQALLSANQSIEQYLTGLRSGPGSYLSSGARLANAEAEFDRLLALARGGDVTARAGLTGAADNLLSASRDQFGSSEMFFERLGFVESTLGNLVGQSGSTATFDNLGATIAQGNASLEYQLVQLNNKVTEMTGALAEQQAVLDRIAAQ